MRLNTQKKMYLINLIIYKILTHQYAFLNPLIIYLLLIAFINNLIILDFDSECTFCVKPDPNDPNSAPGSIKPVSVSSPDSDTDYDSDSDEEIIITPPAEVIKNINKLNNPMVNPFTPQSEHALMIQNWLKLQAWVEEHKHVMPLGKLPSKVDQIVDHITKN